MCTACSCTCSVVLIHRISNQICRKLIQSARNGSVLVLTNGKHERKHSLALVVRCQKICDLSYDISLRICLLQEKNSQAVISLSTLPLIRAL